MKQRSMVAEVVGAIRHDVGTLSAQTVTDVRAIQRRYSKVLIEASPATILAIADSLLSDGSWPERVVACEMLVRRPDAMAQLSETAVDRWGKGLADWGSVDLYGVTIAGVAWRGRRVSDEQVMKWARSSNRWRRRLALVATVPLNSRARGGAGDTIRTLAVCRSLVDDRDDMVVKALSWALRELSKRDRESVARFIHQEESRLAPRVRREVKSKLETGRKLRRRGGPGDD